uniref:BPTI/Kunitz inhibitor domain-containing protein n=1 Tax=Sphaeramia orbicularis TaxID=375764 RepID=A0A673C4G4_9TELE
MFFSPYQLFSSFYISPWCFLVRSHDPPLSSSLPVLCRLPMKVGSCRAAFPRFFYNVTDQTCRRFTYGGCDANSNNFETKEECESTCSGVTERCKAELQVGPCRAAFQRWYFNSLTGRCQRFIYGGCKGNKNNYENEESCRSMCTENCMVTSDPGPCRAAFPAFYYDHKTSTCRSFTYGGCRGNKNRYNTMEECTNRCSQVLCRLPMKVGSCRAAFPRFFYNVTDQTCRRFTYGGCDANSNNFETKEVRAELQVGPCRAAFQRWYFNSLTGRCQRFIYGGCKGNKNNYENEESCRSIMFDHSKQN